MYNDAREPHVYGYCLKSTTWFRRFPFAIAVGTRERDDQIGACSMAMADLCGVRAALAEFLRSWEDTVSNLAQVIEI